MIAARRSSLELGLVGLIAAHSVAVAICLALFPEWSAAFGGWGEVRQTFFARQAGVFHFVVAAGYVYEYLRYGGISLLLWAKSMAVVFLLVASVSIDPVAWAVPVSALGDALMALVACFVHRWVRKRSG